jgi:threonine dehydrogenase-like Zn-dependent dehydrogenase
MKMSMVTGPGAVEVVDVPQPQAGPKDVLIRMRACGICGSDAFYITIGGIPPRQGHTPLGHEPAGEVVEVGTEVSGIAVGDHVVINPMAAPAGIIGNGGAAGALADYLLIENAVRGISLEVIPDHIPFEVASLNEPMAVARHGVNRCRPKPSDKIVVFGAGPIGLGAVLAFKSLGGGHVVVADLIPARLDKAIELLNVMSNEITIVGSMGYPDEIFHVTQDLIANWEKYAVIVSHTVPFENVGAALEMAATPGAADKVIVTFD